MNNIMKLDNTYNESKHFVIQKFIWKNKHENYS